MKTKKVVNLRLFIYLIIFVILFSALLIQQPDVIYSETLQEKLERIELELKDIKNKRGNLEKQLNDLNNTMSGYNSQLLRINTEIAIYESEITELQALIDQVETQIKINDQKIEELKKEIKELEDTILSIEDETDKRIRDSYFSYKMYGNLEGAESILSVENLNDYFKNISYKDILQSETNILLANVARMRVEVIQKKEELDNIQIQNAKQKDLLLVRTADIQKKREDSKALQQKLLSEIYNIRISQQQFNQSLSQTLEQQRLKQAEMELTRQQLINDFVPKDVGSYVLAGTYIAKQGKTGYATGYHLHFEVRINNTLQNPCNFLPPGPGGCGVSGATLQWPIKSQIIQFNSPFGPRCFVWNGWTDCSFHTGIDIYGAPDNTPIYAAHDGFIYKGIDQYGGKYIILCQSANCNSGLKTAYWHVSEY